MDRIIITVLGKDKVGIIGTICKYLSETNINILDINQTIVQGFFNMMMIVDANGSAKPFHELNNELNNIGKELGVRIKLQKEEIFNTMHEV